MEKPRETRVVNPSPGLIEATTIVALSFRTRNAGNRVESINRRCVMNQGALSRFLQWFRFPLEKWWNVQLIKLLHHIVNQRTAVRHSLSLAWVRTSHGCISQEAIALLRRDSWMLLHHTAKPRQQVNVNNMKTEFNCLRSEKRNYCWEYKAMRIKIDFPTFEIKLWKDRMLGSVGRCRRRRFLDYFNFQ